MGRKQDHREVLGLDPLRKQHQGRMAKPAGSKENTTELVSAGRQDPTSQGRASQGGL